MYGHTQNNSFTEMPPKKRTNRYNIKCLECGSIFEFDYRGKHNSLYHEDMKRMHKAIRYEVEGASKNPFEAAKRVKICDDVEMKEKEKNAPIAAHSTAPVSSDACNKGKLVESEKIETTGNEGEKRLRKDEGEEDSISRSSDAVSNVKEPEPIGLFTENEEVSYNA